MNSIAKTRFQLNTIIGNDFLDQWRIINITRFSSKKMNSLRKKKTRGSSMDLGSVLLDAVFLFLNSLLLTIDEEHVDSHLNHQSIEIRYHAEPGLDVKRWKIIPDSMNGYFSRRRKCLKIKPIAMNFRFSSATHTWQWSLHPAVM